MPPGHWAALSIFIGAAAYVWWVHVLLPVSVRDPVADTDAVGKGQGKHVSTSTWIMPGMGTRVSTGTGTGTEQTRGRGINWESSQVRPSASAAGHRAAKGDQGGPGIGRTQYVREGPDTWQLNRTTTGTASGPGSPGLPEDSPRIPGPSPGHPGGSPGLRGGRPRHTPGPGTPTAPSLASPPPANASAFRNEIEQWANDTRFQRDLTQSATLKTQALVQNGWCPGVGPQVPGLRDSPQEPLVLPPPVLLLQRDVRVGLSPAMSEAHLKEQLPHER